MSPQSQSVRNLQCSVRALALSLSLSLAVGVAVAACGGATVADPSAGNGNGNGGDTTATPRPSSSQCGVPREEDGECPRGYGIERGGACCVACAADEVVVNSGYPQCEPRAQDGGAAIDADAAIDIDATVAFDAAATGDGGPPP